ncbi:MAG: hypothetical protein ACOCRX_08705 [Candidatus Woesearchaeota archaeon]
MEIENLIEHYLQEHSFDDIDISSYDIDEGEFRVHGYFAKVEDDLHQQLYSEALCLDTVDFIEFLREEYDDETADEFKEELNLISDD